MKTPNYVFDDELYHHGILGQRWGFRRFQNEDGSWTPEGRERYGEGEGPRRAAKSKVDVRAKARASYEDKKYKMYMKSKEQRLKDKIAAKEERNRVREAAKTERLARKEQAKIDKKMAVRNGTELGKTKNMSDDDLQTAINRLKLEVEYNKNYAIASKPNSTLARADRFFEGPTGQVVKAVAVATIPQIANTFVTKQLESSLKYANKIDRDKAKADIEKSKATAEKSRAEAAAKDAEARKTERESRNKVRLDIDDAERKKFESDREFERQQKNDENQFKLDRKAHQLAVAEARSRSDRLDKKLEATISSQNAKQQEESRRANDIHERDMRERDLDLDEKQAIKFGKTKEMKEKYGKEDFSGTVNNTININNAKRNLAVEQTNFQTRLAQQGKDLETEIKNAKALDQVKDNEAKRNLITEIVRSGNASVSEVESALKSNNDNMESSFKIVLNKESNKPIGGLLPSITNATESKIKAMLANGATYDQIEKKLKVSSSTISQFT